MYLEIYNKICENGKMMVENYGPGSDLHCHHIIPRHMGGDDSQQNLTYLSIREHIIAHYLLWKIYQNPNDIRAMRMLGARLTSKHRRIIGEYCRDNNIGIFSDNVTKEQKIFWSKLAIEKQKEEYLEKGTKNFYYWATEEGRRERATLGGKAGGWKKCYESKEGLFDESKKKEWASLGGKSLTGRKLMYHPDIGKLRKILPNEVDYYLEQGYILGSPIKSCLGKKIKRSENKNCKKVTDGDMTFDSMADAADYYQVSIATISNRCKSSKYPNWVVVS